MADAKGNGLVVDCYVRVKAPFVGAKAESAWVLELDEPAGHVRLQDVQGRLSKVPAAWCRVEKPTGAQKAARERLRGILKAVSDRSKAGKRFGSGE